MSDFNWQEIGEFKNLDRDQLIELKDKIHGALSEMKFQVEWAEVDKKNGGTIDFSWLKKLKYAQMKTKQTLGKVIAQLSKVNATLKEDNKKDYVNKLVLEKGKIEGICQKHIKEFKDSVTVEKVRVFVHEIEEYFTSKENTNG